MHESPLSPADSLGLSEVAITFVAVLGFALANLAADLLYVLLHAKIRLR